MDEKLLERMRKVLTLAKQGATEGEMESAMLRAKEMAMRYNIDLADINLEDPKARKDAIKAEHNGSVRVNSKYYRKHHRFVFALCEQLYDVRVIRSTFRRGSREEIRQIHMIGTSADVVMAQELIRWMDELFPELFRLQVKIGRFTDTAACKIGYYNGLYHGLLLANKKKEEEILATTDQNKYAMVIRSKKTAVDELCAQLFPDMKVTKAKKVKTDHLAYYAGYEKGQTINVTQVGAKAKGAGQLNS